MSAAQPDRLCVGLSTPSVRAGRLGFSIGYITAPAIAQESNWLDASVRVFPGVRFPFWLSPLASGRIAHILPFCAVC